MATKTRKIGLIVRMGGEVTLIDAHSAVERKMKALPRDTAIICYYKADNALLPGQVQVDEATYEEVNGLIEQAKMKQKSRGR